MNYEKHEVLRKTLIPHLKNVSQNMQVA